MQSDAASEPVTATYRPVTQLMHADACAPLYFPAVHAIHEFAELASSLLLRFVPAAQLLQKLIAYYFEAWKSEIIMIELTMTVVCKWEKDRSRFVMEILLTWIEQHFEDIKNERQDKD